MSRRPLIGVTRGRRRGFIATLFTRFAIWRAGGRSRVITPDNAHGLADLDGLVVGGGDDINPTLYGGEIAIDVRLDDDRDKLERQAVRDAEERNLPVLGICRGAQMLNVALGGNLHQEAYAVYTGSRYVRTVLPVKDVTPESDTRLGRILECDTCRVNSLHHQAIDRLGEGLMVAARDDGGMVQAVERPGEPFTVGVQWHPEFLVFDRGQMRLFRRLVAASIEAQRATEKTRQVAALS